LYSLISRVSPLKNVVRKAMFILTWLWRKLPFCTNMIYLLVLVKFTMKRQKWFTQDKRLQKSKEILKKVN
jgi:hypothetical protein